MKAITLFQPWASLVRDGRKKIETRSWSTQFRGRIAIHAGKKVDREACAKFGYDPGTIETGAVLCTAVLVKCVQFPSPMAPPDEYGDFTPGRWGWVLGALQVLPVPLPARGNQGLWNFMGLAPAQDEHVLLRGDGSMQVQSNLDKFLK